MDLQRGRSVHISLHLPLVAAVCLPGCRRAAVGKYGPCRHSCAARVGFHALITHAGVRADAFGLVLVSHPPHSCFFACTQTSRRGAPGLNRPAAYPLRPMMGGIHARPPELFGFPEQFGLSVFSSRSSGL